MVLFHLRAGGVILKHVKLTVMGGFLDQLCGQGTKHAGFHPRLQGLVSGLLPTGPPALVPLR